MWHLIFCIYSASKIIFETISEKYISNAKYQPNNISSPFLQSSNVSCKPGNTQVKSTTAKKNSEENTTITTTDDRNSSSNCCNCTPWKKQNVSKQINFAPKHVECKLIKKNWKLFSAKYLLLLEQKVFQYRTKLIHLISTIRSNSFSIRSSANPFLVLVSGEHKVCSVVWRIFYTESIFSMEVCLFVWVCVCVVVVAGWFISPKLY